MEGVTPSHSFGGEIRRSEPAEKRGVYQLSHIYCLIEGSVSFFFLRRFQNEGFLVYLPVDTPISSMFLSRRMSVVS